MGDVKVLQKEHEDISTWKRAEMEKKAKTEKEIQKIHIIIG